MDAVPFHEGDRSGGALFLVALLYAAFGMNALANLATGVRPNMSVSAMVLTWPRVLAVYAAHLAWPFHLSVCLRRSSRDREVTSRLETMSKLNITSQFLTSCTIPSSQNVDSDDTRWD